MPNFDAHAYLGETPFSNAMATRAAIQQTMQQHDLSAVALISALAARCDFVTGNRQLREVIDPSSGMFGYLTLNTGYPVESQEDQRRYLGQRGFVAGVLFGHDGNPVTLEDSRDILNAHRRYTKPMAIHVPNAAAVHAARQIAAEYPTMKFVLLSMGGEDWHVALTAARQHLNLYLDISGSLDADKVAQAAATITPRKLLFGSGLPYANPQSILALVESASALTRVDRERILSGNAVALFGTQDDGE
ncbi:MAG: amidohydrolase family protein [Armatimonadota bacterium]|nr:amidohydrolase family protein [Armatimonadota bacterium]